MSADRVRAYIALGANLGDSAAKTVLDELRQTPGIAAVTASRFYRTARSRPPAPTSSTPPRRLDTTLAPLELLDVLQALELRHGRERPYKNAPRTLDLDMLLHGDQSSKTSAWSCPIPRTCASCCVGLGPHLRVAGRPACPTGWPTSTTSPSPRCKGAARQPPPHPDIQARHHARPHPASRIEAARCLGRSVARPVEAGGAQPRGPLFEFHHRAFNIFHAGQPRSLPRCWILCADAARANVKCSDHGSSGRFRYDQT